MDLYLSVKTPTPTSLKLRSLLRVVSIQHSNVFPQQPLPSYPYSTASITLCLLYMFAESRVHAGLSPATKGCAVWSAPLSTLSFSLPYTQAYSVKSIPLAPQQLPAETSLLHGASDHLEFSSCSRPLSSPTGVNSKLSSFWHFRPHGLYDIGFSFCSLFSFSFSAPPSLLKELPQPHLMFLDSRVEKSKALRCQPEHHTKKSDWQKESQLEHQGQFLISDRTNKGSIMAIGQTPPQTPFGSFQRTPQVKGQHLAPDGALWSNQSGDGSPACCCPPVFRLCLTGQAQLPLAPVSPFTIVRLSSVQNIPFLRWWP